MKMFTVLMLAVCVYLISEGTSQECVNGLLNAESVRQLGRVAGKLKDNRDKQQRIIPDISFTCTGTVTRWIVAGDWKNEDNLPEVQIWRETNNGSGIYTKIHGTVLPLSSSDESDIYSITADSVDFQPGDVLGLFEPKNTWLQFYYNDKYGPLNYYINTGNDATPPTDDFDIGDADGSANDMPLVLVEINSTDGSSVSDCIRNFATMDAIVAGIEESVRDEKKEQRLIPGINFTCHGFITKWIIAAKWDDDDNYPELQTWNSTDAITYTKQGATTFSVEGGSAEVTYYEYSPDPPHEFNYGDVLGIFVPDKPRFELFYDRVDSAPLNYIDDTGKDVIPPTYDFTIGTTDNSDQNEVPLVAVEVSIPPVPLCLSSSVLVSSPPRVNTNTVPSPTSTPQPTDSMLPKLNIQIPAGSTKVEFEVYVGIAAAVLVGVTVSTVGVVLLVVVRLKRTRHRAELVVEEMKENASYGRVPDAGAKVDVNAAYGVCAAGDDSIRQDINPAYGTNLSNKPISSTSMSNPGENNYDYI